MNRKPALLAALGAVLVLTLSLSACNPQGVTATFPPGSEPTQGALVATASPVVPTKTASPVPLPTQTSLPVPTHTQVPSVNPTATTTRAPTATSTWTPAPTSTPAPTPPLTTAAPGGGTNPIVVENQQPGTKNWAAGPGFAANNKTAQIAGFANPVSVNLGESINFMISTRTAGTTYTLEIYRLGYYNGNGGRLMLTVPDLAGQAQGYWDQDTGGVVDCPTCEIVASTGLIDTHWQSSYTLQVPANWVSGEYLAKLTTAQGAQAYICFAVRDDARASDLLVQFAANTFQAYNLWGGNSLYVHLPNQPSQLYGTRRAVKVSFNRPIEQMGSDLIVRDIKTIRLLESRGYDATYSTSADTDRDPAAIQHHKAFISVGHDEYWTMAMRDAVTSARDAGVSLAFFGGNDVYWQARYEADREGNPRRILVEYRSAATDPMAKTDPALTTVRWISPPVNLPQNSLTGMIYSGLGVGVLAPWVVASTAPQALLSGTGLKPGDSVANMVGWECDVALDNGYQPANLAIVAAARMEVANSKTIPCNTTWYQAASGAYVFNAGMTNWAFALDGFADPRPMKLALNILTLFGVQPASPAR